MKILVSEKDKKNADLLLSCINEICPLASVYLSDDLNEAAEITMKEHFDSAFIDTGNDRIKCIEAVEKLKKITPKLNIIFCSDNSDFMADAIFLHASGYIVRPADIETVRKNMDNLLFPCRISIVCFGHFGITVDGLPVHFKRSKSMEVLAFLVDRRSACSRKQIAAAIFEDRSYDRNCQKYLDNIIRDLKEDLKEAGIPELLIHKNNLFYVNRELFSCDYYDYIEQFRSTYKFHGEYMTQYSWSEVTLSILNNI